jgi:hypothetical protein
MTATAAIGTKLKKGTTVIGELTSIGGLSLSADTRETTTLDSPNGYRTYSSGLKDAGEVSLSGYFNPNEHAGLFNDYESGVVGNYTIEFPIVLGANWIFDAIVTNYETGAELEDSISFEATLKLSGKPTLQLTPSAGISALTVTGTGGTLSPTFNKDVFSYTYNGVTATSVTFLPTAANHDIKYYIDGVLSKTSTSGTAEPFSMTIGTKVFKIEVQEPSKSPKTYTITVTKVS